jgi:hypothetical protein
VREPVPLTPLVKHRQRPPAIPAGSVPGAQVASRSPDRVKMKNPAAPAVRRETEEDWGSKGADNKAPRRVGVPRG